jgi:hypothetical protein
MLILFDARTGKKRRWSRRSLFSYLVSSFHSPSLSISLSLSKFSFPFPVYDTSHATLTEEDNQRKVGQTLTKERRVHALQMSECLAEGKLIIHSLSLVSLTF